MPLYNTRRIVINDSEQYEDLIDSRTESGEIEQYETVFFSSNFKQNSYNVRKHIWSKGDRLFKISARYYGQTKYWWLIGLWNSKPTDAHYSYGDVIEIPFPVVDFYREVIDGTNNR